MYSCMYVCMYVGPFSFLNNCSSVLHLLGVLLRTQGSKCEIAWMSSCQVVPEARQSLYEPDILNVLASSCLLY